MNVVSLFDGMSCGQIALERAGIPVDKYYACEIDKHAIKITQKNYPDTIQLGDVRKIKGEDIGWIDLLLGGSPCQGFSFIGKQLAFNDPRSKLFFEYVRIYKELKLINPDIKFLLENVRMKKEFEAVISVMLGVEPVFIDSTLVSAQTRKRLYWTNLSDEIPQPQDRGIVLQDILEKDVVGYDLSETTLQRVLKQSPRLNPDKAYCVRPNNNTSQFGDKRSATLVGATSYNGKILESDKSNCIDANFFKGPDNHGQRTFIKEVVCLNSKDTSGKQPPQQDRIYDPVGKSPSLLAELGGRNNISTSGKFRRLTERECERLQTVPDNYTQGVSSTQRYRMLGNGWNVDTIVHILSHGPENWFI